LHESYRRAVKQPCQGTLNAFHQSKHQLHLGRRKHNRYPFSLWGTANGLQPGQILADDLLVQKEQGIQRLAMGGRRNLPFVGQHGEEGLDLRFPHILGVAHGAVAAMPTDEKASPIQVGFFGLKAIVQVTNALTKLVQQPNRAQHGSGDFVRFNIPVHKYSILLQVYENKRFFDEQRNTLSDWLPCYPAKLPDTSKLDSK